MVWSARRLVWDGRLHRFLRGRGKAVFRHITGSDWAMREDMIFDGRDACRETIWAHDGATLLIRLSSGLPLVTLDTEDIPSQAWHLCGDDRYLARLIDWSPTSIRLGWRVLGPRKDYVMLTRYVRDG